MGRSIVRVASVLALLGTFVVPAEAAPRPRTTEPSTKKHTSKRKPRTSKPEGTSVAPAAPAATSPAPSSSAEPALAPASPPPSSPPATVASNDRAPSPSLESAALSVSTERDRVVDPKAAPPQRRVTIGVNPLPIIAGRYGLNVELLPLRHHGVFASAWVQTFTPSMLRVVMPKELDVSRGADTLVGGELGYRFYTGAAGAEGLFAGLSGVAMPIAYPRVTPDLKSEVVSFHAYGGALDVGVQAITSSGFTIGGGLGVMYLAYTPPPSITPPPGITVSLAEPHVLPRLLLSAGWSF